jgi:DNA-binding XRE family transcriptional regulator
MTDTPQTEKRVRVSLEDVMAKRGMTWEDVEPYKRELERYLDGYALAEVRKAQGVTQRQLAQRIGVSQNRISKIEKGDFHKTQLRTVQKYIEALGGSVSIGATFGDTVIPLRLG